MYDAQNIFAKILREEIPCSKIFEDDFCLAFYDINPQAQVHALVIPKGEYLDFSDFIDKASSEEVNGFFRGLKFVSASIGVEDDGYRIISNKGENGGQEVPHFHVHLFGGEKLGKMI